jgi:hypothetical protein
MPRKYNLKHERGHASAHNVPFLPVSKALKLPSSVDLRQHLPAVYDQGELGSCTANAGCGALQFLGYLNPSRLMLYYDE